MMVTEGKEYGTYLLIIRRSISMRCHGSEVRLYAYTKVWIYINIIFLFTSH